MTYIKLEDALKTVNGHWIRETKLELLNSLPTINPESMIEEMMEARNDCNDDFQKGFDFALVTILQKFKS